MNQAPEVTQRGDIAIYMALIIVTILVSSALLLSFVLVRQIRETSDALASERAFFAANSGIEQALSELDDFANPFTGELAGVIEYDNGQQAAYEARGLLQGSAQAGGPAATRCVRARGVYPENGGQREERRLNYGPDTCLAELDTR